MIKFLPYGIMLLLVVGLWGKFQDLALLEIEFDKQATTIEDLQGVNDTNVKSLAECEKVNTDNKEIADQATIRAIEAEKQIRIFEGFIESNIEDIKVDENELRSISSENDTCYTLVARLPDFLFD